jgi:beclin 1
MDIMLESMVTVLIPFSNFLGLRLGRGADPHIEWSEINAALGLCLLLLYTLAKRLDFKFVGFELVPLGSFSRIDRIDGSCFFSLTHSRS